MKIRLEDGLPYITVTLTYQGQSLSLENVLLDTGSGGTVFAAEKLLAVNIKLEPDDTIHRIRGVGGAEFVFTKQINRLAIGDLAADNFEIEVGAMQYGFDIDGIIGMDFLRHVKAIIDLGRSQIYSAS